jgi:hypothetical protein
MEVNISARSLREVHIHLVDIFLTHIWPTIFLCVGDTTHFFNRMTVPNAYLFHNVYKFFSEFVWQILLLETRKNSCADSAPVKSSFCFVLLLLAVVACYTATDKRQPWRSYLTFFRLQAIGVLYMELQIQELSTYLNPHQRKVWGMNLDSHFVYHFYVTSVTVTFAFLYFQIDVILAK